MYFEMPLPTWKQIIRRNEQRANKTFYEGISNKVLFLSESYMSISLIIHAIREDGNKEQVVVLVPDYYSKDAVSFLQDNRVRIVYYPICSDLNPDWAVLKEWTKENPFDAFVFTHYFGKFFGSISRAKEICKRHGAVLIEDCTHVLYPTGKMGTSGDFAIYSPHKQLPIMDGEVLVCNSNCQKEYIEDVFSTIQRRFDGLQEETATFSWYTKKALQKLNLLRRDLSVQSCPHSGTDTKRNCKLKKISRASYNSLCDYTYLDLKRIAYIRRDNLEMMNYIMSRLFPEATPLLGREVDVPYVAAYSIGDTEKKKELTNDMLNAGITLLHWADPSFSIEGDEGHDQAKRLLEDIILLPIHQMITPQKLVKRFLLNQ